MYIEKVRVNKFISRFIHMKKGMGVVSNPAHSVLLYYQGYF